MQRYLRPIKGVVRQTEHLTECTTEKTKKKSYFSTARKGHFSLYLPDSADLRRKTVGIHDKIWGPLSTHDIYVLSFIPTNPGD